MLQSDHQFELSLGGFRLWVFGRQFPDAEDFWDGNWLDVRAECETDFAKVHCGGPIIRLSELHQLKKDCEQIYQKLSGKASLDCLEPHLKLEIEMQSFGKCDLTVSMNPDIHWESHSFLFEIDQTYLPPFLHDLEMLLKHYPLRGER